MDLGPPWEDQHLFRRSFRDLDASVDHIRLGKDAVSRIGHEACVDQV